MSDTTRDPKEPTETITIAHGPNPTGHTDQAVVTQQRELAPHVAVDETPDPATLSTEG